MNEPHREYRDYRYVSAAEPHTGGYLFEAVLDVLQKHPSVKRVLDAGCGNGALTARLARSGYDVAGFDLSESGIEQAQKAFPGVKFAVGSVYEPFSRSVDGAFDAVVSLEVIEHLYDPRRLVQNAYDALPKGGLFVLSTPYHGYLKNLALAVTGKLDHHFTALWDGGHIKFFSRRTLEALLGERGFEVIDFRGAGRLPLLWKSMVLAARKR